MKNSSTDSSDLKNGTDLQGLSFHSDKWMSVALFGLIAVFTVTDVLFDMKDGAPLSHFPIEILIASVSIGGFFYFLLKNKKIKKALILESANRKEANAQAALWKTKNEKLLLGFSKAISDQLNEWKLSPAEKDVALFLLKGFSTAEIANLRSSSEKTIKQQASSIYSKSGISGRAELSAFFLEEVLSL